MAQIAQRLSENVDGDFYVDASCIDCDACRQIAPASFRDHGAQSSVYQQPRTAEETERALMALVACPTASIGTVSHRNARAGVQAFPEHLFANVYFCGYTAESSFGAWAYLIVRPADEGGNVLVGAPIKPPVFTWKTAVPFARSSANPTMPPPARVASVVTAPPP